MWSLKQHKSGQIELVETDLVQYDTVYAQSSSFFPKCTQKLHPNSLKYVNIQLLNAVVATCKSKSPLMLILPFCVSMEE